MCFLSDRMMNNLAESMMVKKYATTTIDYLITGQVSDDAPLHNKRLLQKFKLLEGFGASQQETVINVIDAMVAKHQMEETLKNLGSDS
ncbi:hypothetical protein [Catenovulum sediminis]|uniref:Uncharacterized protein n=1 Tax=Catenovulum sediminis TaxID=1740262 RepID=A0ABV1RGE9_9ALTE